MSQNLRKDNSDKIEAKIVDVEESDKEGVYDVEIEAVNRYDVYKIPFFNLLLDGDYLSMKSVDMKPGKKKSFSTNIEIGSEKKGKLEISLTAENEENKIYDKKEINLESREGSNSRKNPEENIEKRDIQKQKREDSQENKGEGKRRKQETEEELNKETKEPEERRKEIKGKEKSKEMEPAPEPEKSFERTQKDTKTEEEKTKEKSFPDKEEFENVKKNVEEKPTKKPSRDVEKEENRGIIDRLLHKKREKPEEEGEKISERIEKPEGVEEKKEEKEIEKSVPEKRFENIDRISTGIIDLDDKMEGGFVENSVNLITGKTGTGKTAFCSSFLFEGAQKSQPGIYLTTEERKEDLKNDISAMFGWDMDEFDEKGLVKIISLKPMFPSKEIENLNRLVKSYISNLLDNVEDNIEDMNAERIVVDSVSVIEMFISDEYLSRVALSSLMNNLRELNVTAVLTGTVPETSEGLSGGGIIEYLVDTVIKLEFMPVAEEHKRTLAIRKMRRTDHSVMVMPFDITPQGLKIIEIS